MGIAWKFESAAVLILHAGSVFVMYVILMVVMTLNIITGTAAYEAQALNPPPCGV